MGDKKRAEILAETADTYARYADLGYGDRWSQDSAGSKMMNDEREASLTDAVGSVAGITILDLGCGGGGLALALDRLSGRPGRYVGIDLLDTRIEIARQRVPWGQFYAVSADRLPIADNSIDVVVAATLFSSIIDGRFRRCRQRDRKGPASERAGSDL